MYVATKHALTGLVRSLADLEFPPVLAYGEGEDPDVRYIHPIRVTAVAPGRTQTPLWTDHSDKMEWVKDMGVGSWITPEEVATIMVELIENPSYVGGTIIEIPDTGTWQVVHDQYSRHTDGRASPVEPTLAHGVWDGLRARRERRPTRVDLQAAL
jgi:NAD(P)-dependent dehydrogenase (short-subunit alcohol dehydrogenase family)